MASASSCLVVPHFMMTAPAVGADLPDGISSYALTVTVEDYYDRGVFAYQDDDFTEYSYLVDVEKGKDNAYYRVSMPDMPDVLVMDKSLHRLQKALMGGMAHGLAELLRTGGALPEPHETSVGIPAEHLAWKGLLRVSMRRKEPDEEPLDRGE